MASLILVVTVLYLLFYPVETGNVLVLFLFTQVSWRQVVDPLIEGLAENGHEVTVLSPLKLPTPVRGVREIGLEEVLSPLKVKDGLEMRMAGTYKFIGNEIADVFGENANICEKIPQRFWENDFHIESLFTYSKLEYIYYAYWVPSIEKVVRKHYGSIPPIREIEKNASMMLVNTDPLLHGPMALLPSIVSIGGIHCSAGKPLPKVGIKTETTLTTCLLLLFQGRNLTSNLHLFVVSFIICYLQYPAFCVAL